MTDNELKFFDPETGAELHRVPEGATIPRRTPYGLIENGKHQWQQYGSAWDFIQKDNVPRFTREPIAPPKPTDPYLDLKPFRHPSISGKAECLECGNPFEMHGWLDKGSHGFTVCPFDFTPTEPETPPLPTEPGFYLDKDGDLWHVNNEGKRKMLLVKGEPVEDLDYPWGDAACEYAPFVHASIVPTETWDRLRVLDPEDTRDRVDQDGDVMRFTRQSKAAWGEELAARHFHYGPLRFADEVSGDE